MGLLNEKDKVLIEAVKKYAGNESLQCEKIRHLLENTDILKRISKTLSEEDLNFLTSSIEEEIIKATDEVNIHE